MRQHVITTLAILGLAACGGGYDGGGNVGFGGAQDIGQFRQILDDGDIPGEQTLDANGFFNEHFTELPAADCGQDLCLHGLLAVGRDWVRDEYQATMQIALSSPIDPETLERLPLNLVVVIDTSGSMQQDDRIGYVKQGLHLLIDELQDGDRLALVAYNGSVESLYELSSDLDRPALHGIVEGLVAEGSTNLHGGLERGFEIALEALDPAHQNRVILLSDGLPTAGVTDDESIIRMAEDYIGSGIGLTTVGVGRDFNVTLMRGLAERGAGNFYFLENPSAVREVFTEELDYFVTPIALSVNIEVVSSQDYGLGEVVGTRLWKTSPTGGSMFVPAVFLASRVSDDPGDSGRRGGGSAIFINMVPRPGGATGPHDVAEIRLSYRLPGSDETMEQVVVPVNPTDPGALPLEDVYLSTEAVAEHYAIYNTFLGLREATRRASSNYHCARAALETVKARLGRWNDDLRDDDLTADEQLIDQFIANLTARGALTAAELGDDPCAGSYYGDDYTCSVTSGQGAPLTGLLIIGALAWIRRRR